MNSFIDSLNAMLIAWKKEHDIFNAISLTFHDCNGFLCFGVLPLCKLDEDLQVEGAEASNEGISIFLNNKRSILISFVWPEDEPPQVELVCLIYRLYDDTLVFSESDS